MWDYPGTKVDSLPLIQEISPTVKSRLSLFGFKNNIGVIRYKRKIRIRLFWVDYVLVYLKALDWNESSRHDTLRYEIFYSKDAVTLFNLSQFRREVKLCLRKDLRNS